MADQGSSAIGPSTSTGLITATAGSSTPAPAAAVPPPPTTSSLELEQQQLQLEGLESRGGAASGGGGGGREYRKGNWTLQETMILIQGKKMDDERRLKGGDKEKGKSAEFRWKWVENFCWKKGCQRSQNQCNDKWDNLLRDYKKVREFESKLAAAGSSSTAAAAAIGTAVAIAAASPTPKSYWQLEKHERKERGLPSNMIIQVYEALHEVVDKRPRPLIQQQQQQQQIQQQQQQQIQQQQQHFQQQIPLLPPQQQPQIHQHPIFSHPVHLPGPSAGGAPLQQATEVSKSTESEDSEVERSPSTKRRKVSREAGLAPTVSKSAYELSQTLLACEEKKDKRHRDLLGFEERKLVLEQAKTEISRQGMEGLIAAVNNLANAILTLVSDRQQPPG